MAEGLAPLKEKVAIITGAAHPEGIGYAIAAAFCDAGAIVYSCDLEADNGKGECLQCDVTRIADATSVANEVLEKRGRIDVLVNNAGVGTGNTDFLQLTDDDWSLNLNVNLLGISNMCRAIIPSMQTSGGAIVNVASLAGLGAMEGIPACYTASKFAAIGLTKALALQYAERNIRVNAICPGSVATQMHRVSLENLAQKYDISLDEAQAMENSHIPLGRSAPPNEIASTAVFLASDAASYLTGVALPVAGGMQSGL